jgi:hypothetical protein
MQRLFWALDRVVVTFWVGGLWVTGYVVAPLLFARLPSRQLAGTMAGTLFSWIAYLALGCALYALVYRLGRLGLGALKQPVFWVILLMAALAAAGQFGVQPILASLKDQALPREVMESVFRDRFAAWHGVSSILYLVESALGLVLVLLTSREGR